MPVAAGHMDRWPADCAARAVSILIPSPCSFPTNKTEYHGCFSVNDLLKNLMVGVNAKAPHWLEQGASAFSADDLVAVGKELCGKSVGDLEHGEGLVTLL